MEYPIKYEYATIDVTLLKNTLIGQEVINIPDGRVVAMGVVLAGDPEDRIINVGVFDNNNETVKTADYRFSEKTNGGTYKDSLRPVDFSGGKNYQIRLLSNDASATENVTAQVLFMIEKP